MPNPLLAAALDAHAAGLVVMPVNAGGPYDKRPHWILVDTGHSKPWAARPGRVLPAWHTLMTTRPTEDMLHVWFSHPRGKGLAVVTGQLSGRLVIDLDGDAGDTLRRAWGLRPHVRTGSGGWHVHVRMPAWRVPTLNGKSARLLGEAYPGLDTRADGGYAILPPTVSQKGAYRALRPLADLEEKDILPLPALTLLGLVAPPPPPQTPLAHVTVSPRLTTDITSHPTLSELLHAAQADALHSGRNKAGFLLACRLRNTGMSAEDVRAVAFHRQVHPANTKGEAEPYTQAEWEASVASAFQQQPRPRRRASRPIPALEQLRDVWPRLTESDRGTCISCVLTSLDHEGAAALRQLGVNEDELSAAHARVQRLRAQGESLPGLTFMLTHVLPPARLDARQQVRHTEQTEGTGPA